LLVRKMNMNTVEELTQYFLKTLSTMNNALLLTNATVDESYMEVKDSLMDLLDNVKLVLRSIHRDVDIAQEQLKSLQDTKAKCQDMMQHLQFVITNMPLNYSTRKNSHKQLTSKIINCDQGGKDHNIKSGTNQVTRSCSYLNFLTVDDFEVVPKYMKGRLTYERVNSIIEQLDKVFSEKYKLMKLKTGSLNDLNRKRVEVFRLQENSDTEGVSFIVEKDIADFSSLKVDSNVRNCLTILRHFCMLQEVRGGGYVRFAVGSRF